jgi:TetR/AcrR family transcriptional repressor of nem operon
VNTARTSSEPEAKRGQAARDKLVGAGTELLRRQGYNATTVDQVCEAAGFSKGAFFHHFKNKEALAEACLQNWDALGAAMESGAPYQSEQSPLARLSGYMDFFISFFEKPLPFRSCLAGTVVQEVAGSNDTLREAASQCFMHAEQRLIELLDNAGSSRGRALDSLSLARLWFSTFQGSLLLAKATQDNSVISSSLKHVRQYVLALLMTKQGR